MGNWGLGAFRIERMRFPTDRKKVRHNGRVLGNGRSTMNSEGERPILNI